MQITIDGQIAEKTVMSLDAEKIAEESRYDGYYCVSTNLEGSVQDILRINRGRWEIEESFRMMKSEFQGKTGISAKGLKDQGSLYELVSCH